MYTLEDIQAVDMEVAQAITDELDRQNSHIELIASENWVSPAVMSAMGSVLTNKYAEGYPGKRYYGGCASDGTAKGTGRTARASAWTLWKNWQESAQKNYLGVSMSMCSHIPVRRQIWRYSLQF